MKAQHKELLELAKKAYNSSEVCSKWKEEILKAVPELNRFEEGKWYTNSNGSIVCATKSGVCLFGYGFNNYRVWFSDNGIGWGDFHNPQPATKEEVEEALIKEAKRRYKDGYIVKLIDTNLGGIYGNMVRLTEFKYFNDPQLYTDGNLLIFKNGKWAEIIEGKPKEVTIEEIQEKFGCKVKIIES